VLGRTCLGRHCLERKNWGGAAILNSDTVLNWKYQNNCMFYLRRTSQLMYINGDRDEFCVHQRPVVLGFCRLGAGYAAQRLLILRALSCTSECSWGCRVA
jgi:hypothetical protein